MLYEFPRSGTPINANYNLDHIRRLLQSAPQLEEDLSQLEEDLSQQIEEDLSQLEEDLSQQIEEDLSQLEEDLSQQIDEIGSLQPQIPQSLFNTGSRHVVGASQAQALDIINQNNLQEQQQIEESILNFHILHQQQQLRILGTKRENINKIILPGTGRIINIGVDYFK